MWLARSAGNLKIIHDSVFLNWVVDIRYLFNLLLHFKFIYVNSLHYMYGAFNNEKKFNKNG